MVDTTSPDDVLMLAIMSMDAYNRDTSNTNININNALSKIDDSLGGASILSREYDPNTLFGAVAYSWGGQTIIAYRGTVFKYFLTEVWNGYGVGAGSPYGAQAEEAIDFYQEVAENNNLLQNGFSGAGITLTGHSLGGGLAGFIGALYGQQGVLFDNMPFQLAASNAYIDSTVGPPPVLDVSNGGPDTALASLIYGASTPYPNNIDYLSAYSVTGQIIGQGGINIAGGQTIVPTQINPYGTASGVELHSQALLVSLLWAQDNDDVLWQSIGGPLLNAFFGSKSQNIAVALGLGDDSSVTLTEVAYTALGMVSPGGSDPFGTTALNSLFTDADTLGELQTNQRLSGLISGDDILNSLAEIVYQYAGDQAASQQINSSFNAGALSIVDDDILDVNLDPSKWKSTFGTGAASQTTGQDDIVGLGDFVVAVENGYKNNTGDGSIRAVVPVALLSKLDDAVTDSSITQILAVLGSGNATIIGGNAPNTYDGLPGSDLIVGNNGNDTITAPTGQDFIFLGNGSNTIDATWGDDVIVEGLGQTTISIDDTAFSKGQSSSNSDTTYVLSNQDGGSTTVDIGASLRDSFKIYTDQNSPVGVGTGWTEYVGTDNGETYTLWVEGSATTAPAAPTETTDLFLPTSATADTSASTDEFSNQEAPQLQTTTDDNFTSVTISGQWNQDKAVRSSEIVAGAEASGYGNKIHAENYTSATPLSGGLNDGQKVTFKGVVFQGDKLYGTGLTFKNFQILYADPTTGGATYDDYISGQTDFKDIYLGNGNNVVDNLSGGVLAGQAQTLGAAAHWVTVNLGTGNSQVLGTTAPGSEIFAQGATHHDIINISPDIEINNLTADDRLTYDGEVITGGTGNVASGTDWYTSADGRLEFAVDSSDELVIKPTTSYLTQLNNALFGVTTSVDPATYVTNYQAANIAGNGDLVTGATAGITLVAVKYSVHMLLGGTPFVELNPFFIYNAESLAWFGKNYEKFDPLVVDLAGTGLNFTAVDKGQGPRFDVTGDGFANPSSWITPGEGYLVTVAANGAVSLVTSFAQLAAYDANGDGTLDASDLASAADAALPELRVWIDPTSGHTPQDDDLLTFAQAGLQSISLAPTAAADDDVIGDVLVNATASVTLTSGVSSTVGAVTLNVDYADSTWQGDDSVTTNAAALPNLTGAGTLPDLDVALSLDENAQIAAGTLTGGAPTALESAVAASVANFPNVTPTLADWRQAADAVLTDWADAFANPLPGSTANWWNDATDPTGVGADGAPNGAPDVYDLVQTNADGSTTVVETLSYQTYQQTIEVGSTSETVTRGQWVEGAAGSLGDDVISQQAVDADLAASLPSNESWQVAGAQNSYVVVQTNADGSQTVLDTLEFVATPYTGDDAPGATSAGYWAFASGRPVTDASGDTIADPTLAQALATPLGADDAIVINGNTTAAAARPNYYYAYTLDSDDVMTVVDDLEYKVTTTSEEVYDPATNSEADENIATGQWVWGSGAPLQHYVNGQLVDFTASTLDEALQAYIPSNESWGELTAAELTFYERYTGQPVYFGDATPNEANWTSVMNEAVNQAVNTIDLLTLQLFVQSPLNQTIFSTLSFDTAANEFTSNTPYGLEPVYQSIFATLTGLSGDALTSALSGWHSILQELQSYYAPPNDDVLTDGYVLSAIVAADDAVPLQMSLVDIAGDLGVPTSEIVSGQGTVTGSSSGDNLFLVGPGQNTYVGANTNNEYIVESNFGNSVIDDSDAPFGSQPTDIRFATLTSDDVLLSQSGDDLIITDELTGATLRVVNQFVNPNYQNLFFIGGNDGVKYGVDDLIFANGVVWDKNDISFQIAQRNTSDDTLYGTSGDDVLFGGPGDTLVGNANSEGGSTTYVYDVGMGDITIAAGPGNPTAPENATLLFGPGITEDDLIFSRNPSALDDMMVTIASTGATIDLKNQFEYEYNFILGGAYTDRVDTFAFSDGSILSADDAMNAVIDDEIASGGTIYGDPSGNVFDPGPGNVDRMIYGEGGDDTFVFGVGYGTVTILAQPRAIDNPDFSVVNFGPGITADDLVLTRPGDDLNDLDIGIAGTDDVLTVENEFEVSYPLGGATFMNQISQFNFADGTSLSADQIRALWFQQEISAPAPAAYGQVVYGTPFDDTFALSEGNRWRILSGGNGSDTYDFNLGDGTVVIRQATDDFFGQGDDTVAFGPGITVDDLALTNIWNTNNLQISVNGTDDSLIITNEYNNQWNEDFIAQFTFANGATYTAEQLAALANLAPPSGNALIVSSNFDDTLVAGTGDDILVGKEGNHVFEFAPGFGNDYIDFGDGGALPSQNSVDTVQFEAGITLADLSFYADDDSLIIHENGTDSTVTIANPGAPSEVQNFIFGDGTTMTAAQIEAMMAANPQPILTTTSNGPALEASVSGTILQGAGHFAYSSGDGTVIIQPETFEGFTVTFNNISSSDVQLSLLGIDSNTFVFTFAGDPDDRLVVNNVTQTYSTFVFSNGVTWSADELDAQLLQQETANDDEVIQQPNLGDQETIVSAPGQHILEVSGSRDTFVWSLGDGFTTIEPSTGQGNSDTLIVHGISPDEVTVYRDPSDGDMYLFLDGSDAPSIQVREQYSLANGVISSLQFDDGTIWNSSELVIQAAGGIASTPTITASPGQTSLVGAGDDDVLDPGTGNLTMTAGPGNNVYIYRSDYGDDVINPGSALQSQYYGAIRLPDLDVSDVTLSRSGYNLIVTVDATGHTLTVSNFFVTPGAGSAPGTMQGIEYLLFADGTQLTQNQIEPLAWYYAGSGDDVTVTSTNVNATMFAGPGDDTLVGDNQLGNTDDTFIYASTNGNLTIDSNSGSYDVDSNTLRLTDLNPEDITLTRSGDDLLIRVDATGKTITVANEFVTWAYDGIQAIQFADGTTWQWTHLNQFYAAADGDESFSNNGPLSTVVFTDLNASDVSLSRNGAGDDVIITVNSTGDTVTLQGDLDWELINDRQFIAVTFADGTTWTVAQLEQNLLAQESAANSGSIYGFQFLPTTIVAGPGNKYLDGLGAADTYVYASADGDDVIADPGSSSNLVFSDIDASDVTLSRDGSGNDLTITVNSTGHTITVQGQFSYWNGGTLQSFTFADGTVWTAAQAQQIILNQESAAPSGSVYGFDYGSGPNTETLVAGPGNKYLDGLGGIATYVYSSADGDDVIADPSDLSNLVFSDIDASGVTLSRDGSSNDLTITVTSTGNTITVQGQFSFWNNGALQSLAFADGTVWTAAQVQQIILNQESAAPSGSVYGFNYGFGPNAETLVAGPGNKYLDGLGGKATYVYSSADGDDVIADPSDLSNLVFSDIDASGVTLSRDGSSNDLTITVNSTGNTITVQGQFSYWNNGALQSLTFADGTVWTAAQVQQMLLNQESAAPSGSVYGYDFGSGPNDETLVAGPGNKYLDGLGGKATYVYSSSDGDDVIADPGDSSNLVFSDIDASDVTLSSDGNDLAIAVNSTGKTITVQGELSSDRSGSLEAVSFADGTVWKLPEVKELLASEAGQSGVSVAYFLENQAQLDAAGEILITDSAANISASLDALNADAAVQAIDLTDSGTPTLTLTVAQALNDSAALSDIANPDYGITVSDTLADVLWRLSALEADAQVTSIVADGWTLNTGGAGSNPEWVVAPGSVATISDGQTVTLSGSTINQGTIALGSTGDWTNLNIGSSNNDTVTLSGGGTIALGDNSRNDIQNGASNVTLGNVDNTIEGAGGIYNLTVANSGLIEATLSAGLTLSNTTIDEAAGGLLEAAGADVYLNGADIVGGPVTTTNGGMIEATGGSDQLDGTGVSAVTITSGSTVEVEDSQTLTLDGTSSAGGSIVNQGTVALASTGDWTNLNIGSSNNGTVTLSGGGTIALGDNSRNEVQGSSSNDTLVNVDNTIEGAGQVYNLTVANSGLIEATLSVGLTLSNTTIDEATGGLLEAAGADVYLNGADIVGGPLTTMDGGVIEATGGNDQLDGTGASAVTITSGSTVEVEDSQTLTLDGTSLAGGAVVNQGTIALASTGDWTNLNIGSSNNGTVTLSGGGTIALDDNSRNDIQNGASNVTLDNVDNTIEGAGGIVGITLTNASAGVIDADSSDNGLTLSSMTLANSGTLMAQNGGTLALNNVLANISDDANNAGGSVLTGGTYDVIDPVAGGAGSGGSSVIAISGGSDLPVTTLAATVNLVGATSELTSDGEALSSSLLEVAVGGALNLAYGVNSGSQPVFDDSNNPLEIAGSVALDGASLIAQSLTIDSGGALTGAGIAAGDAEVSGPIVNNGSIVDAGNLSGTLEPAFVINGPVSGTGAISIGGDSAVEFTGVVASGQGITFDNSETTGLEILQFDATTIGSAGAVQASIADFKMGDAIDLTNLADATGYTFEGGVLMVSFADGASASFTMQGLGADTVFNLESLGANGTRITVGMSESLVGASGVDDDTDSPALTGVADAGAKVYFYDDGSLIGSTVASATTGDWEFTPTGLSDGAQTVVADELDGAGVIVGSVSQTFTLTSPTSGDGGEAVATALSESPAPGDTIAVSDTAADVSANIDALNADGYITSISLMDSGTPTLGLTAAQALADTAALGEIANSNYAIAVFDSAANVSALFDALNADPRVTAITLTDSGTPTLALTAAQAAADATALSEITNPDYAVWYSDVTDLGYSSYKDLHVGGGGPVAEARHVSNGANSLLLYGDGLTVSSASGQLSVTAASDSFALKPHAHESINASGADNETLEFGSGFGYRTIKGFLASGPNADTIRLNTSMFSYLTPTMTQAQDAAAVLGQATQVGADLVIADSANDTLILHSVAKATLVANPGDLRFT